MESNCLKYHLVRAIAEVAKLKPAGFVAADVWAHVEGNENFPPNLRTDGFLFIRPAFAIAARKSRAIAQPKVPLTYSRVGDEKCKQRSQRVWTAYRSA